MSTEMVGMVRGSQGEPEQREAEGKITVEVRKLRLHQEKGRDSRGERFSEQKLAALVAE